MCDIEDVQLYCESYTLHGDDLYPLVKTGSRFRSLEAHYYTPRSHDHQAREARHCHVRVTIGSIQDYEHDLFQSVQYYSRMQYDNGYNTFENNHRF